LQLNPRPLKGPLYPDWPYGKKYQERYFKDGKENGLWTEWYENGQKKEELIYKDGKLKRRIYEFTE
jgi:antitoxin component YwqK of YwqJK toxin-antitoxin module